MKQRHRKHRLPPSLIEAVNNFARDVRETTLQAGVPVAFANTTAHKNLIKAIREYADRPVDPSPKIDLFGSAFTPDEAVALFADPVDPDPRPA